MPTLDAISLERLQALMAEQTIWVGSWEPVTYTPREAKPMSESTKALKREFATLPLPLALARVRCGFELETQAVDGLTYEDIDEVPGEVDENARDETRERFVYKILQDAKREWHVFLRGETNKIVLPGYWYVYNDDQIARHIKTVYNRGDHDGRTNISLETILNGATTQERDDILDILNDQAADVYPDRSFQQESPGLDLHLPANVEAKHDGTVSGPEFVISGAGTQFATFAKALRGLFTRFDLDVDETCSFHTHVSVPGIQHCYGPKFQLYLYEYLMQNLARVPSDVRDRWANHSQRNEYFAAELSDEKYSFVNFHGRCGTWEFRCFGNVSRARDGLRCLRLAVEALQFAYRVQLGLAKSLFSGIDEYDSGMFERVLKGQSLTDQLRAKRIADRIEDQEAA